MGYATQSNVAELIHLGAARYRLASVTGPGAFGHHNNRWAKWMGKYRDHIRNSSKSSLNNRTVFKRLIEGRGDAGGGAPASTKPWRSVNFLAVHDGYTLRDCVSFQDDGGSHNCWDSGGDENLRRERVLLPSFKRQSIQLTLLMLESPVDDS